jgi:hypothetical protein
MKVEIRVKVSPGGYGYQTLAEREVAVEAELPGLHAIPWAAVCAGLAEAALTEAETKAEEEEN